MKQTPPLSFLLTTLATVMNMDRVRGDDALPRLAKGMSVEPMRDWMQQPQTELYAALPERFIADWDSTVNTRYGHQEDAALGYNPDKRGRKSHHPLIYEALKSYRLAVPARLPNNQLLLDTLLKLTPEPGHTPDAVNASAVFVAPNQFRVVYDASTDADLKEYQLRGNAGATFKSEDAVVITTNGKKAAREFLSAFALTQPGAKGSVAVYVITNAGNEKGSTPMTITRPAA